MREGGVSGTPWGPPRARRGRISVCETGSTGAVHTKDNTLYILISNKRGGEWTCGECGGRRIIEPTGSNHHRITETIAAS